MLKDDNPSHYVLNQFLGLRKLQPALTDCTWKCQRWKLGICQTCKLLLFPMLVQISSVYKLLTVPRKSTVPAVCNLIVPIDPMHGCYMPQVRILTSLLWQWTWRALYIGVMATYIEWPTVISWLTKKCDSKSKLHACQPLPHKPPKGTIHTEYIQAQLLQLLASASYSRLSDLFKKPCTKNTRTKLEVEGYYTSLQ
jgi:hypothetical protein